MCRGLITLEDIIEEIVGDISDETDHVHSEFTIEADGSVVALASISVRDLNRHMDWNLPDDDSSTMGGLITRTTERIPSPGELVEIGHYRVTILENQGNWLEKIKVAPITLATPPADGMPMAGDAAQS